MINTLHFSYVYVYFFQEEDLLLYKKMKYFKQRTQAEWYLLTTIIIYLFVNHLLQLNTTQLNITSYIIYKIILILGISQSSFVATLTGNRPLLNWQA
jgi:hypothetical protein